MSIEKIKLGLLGLEKGDWNCSDMNTFLQRYHRYKLKYPHYNFNEIDEILKNFPKKHPELFQKFLVSKSHQNIRKNKVSFLHREVKSLISLKDIEAHDKNALKRVIGSTNLLDSTNETSNVYEESDKPENKKRRVSISSSSSSVDSFRSVCSDSTFNPEAPMWMKVYNDYKNLSKSEVEKLSIKQKALRIALIEWIEESQ